MTDLNTYISEFVAITAHCIAGQLGRSISKNRYAVEKPLLVGFLDKNRYEESAVKLQFWKALRWIDADEKHNTLCVYDPEDKTRKRMVVIHLSVFEKLREFVI